MMYGLYAGDMLDGDYKFRSTVKESTTNEKYPFKMKLNIENDHITGDIDYYLDNCSGIIRGQILSAKELKLSETITKGKNICDNGTYLYSLKHQIISKSDSYTLENDRHRVIINQYSFSPEPYIWNNTALKNDISQIELDIEALENKISEIKDLIEKTENKKSQSQQYLDQNHTAFIDGQCVKLPLEPEPDPLFDTEEKANYYALAYCSVSFGCRVGVELAGDKLDTAAKRFLASQSCTLMVKSYQKQDSMLAETMFNLLDAASYAGCDEESDDIFSAVLQGGSCVMSAATRLARVGQYIGCIDYKTKEFYDSYLNWKNAPEKKKMDCDKDLKIVNETPKIVAKYNEEILIVKKQTDLKISQLQQVENELAEVVSLRKKQSQLMEQLQN